LSSIPTRPRTARPRSPLAAAVALGVALALVVGACSSGSPDTGSPSALGNPGDCLVVDMAISPEKLDLLTDLAQSFNRTQTEVEERCVFINPKSKASGGAMEALAVGWDTAVDGPQPVIWSPASSAWGAILDQRLADEGEAPMAGEGVPFMNTPLVIAMPEPMATALGWPAEALGWSDLIALSTDTRGWAAHGHPEWGPFRLGKTSPEFSTSGLSALIAQNYAGAGKVRDLTVEDLGKAAVVDTNRQVESAVVHYGETTLTFLNNWYRADREGTALQYVSAVAVEEKSVIDYNTGNPDGVLDPGEEPRPPKVPLVAIYPKEGTTFSDNPFFVLDAPWVTAQMRAGALAFQEYVQQPENQERVLEYNFRPGNPNVPIGPPVEPANGVDPAQPQTLLQLPPPPVMVQLLDNWALQRKDARVLLVVDISGSMKEMASRDGRDTKLELASRAAVTSLDQFKASDQVGLRVFSTGLGPNGNLEWEDRVPTAPMAQNEVPLRDALQSLFPTNGTPLYSAALSSFQVAFDQYDPARINAVVLLTDGKNDDGATGDDAVQLAQLLATLAERTQGELSRPVRIFTIGYGADADLSVLRQIAEATNGAAYNASDPSSIQKVFTSVVSNF
jgi:Ca-activated chloride channel family protein